MPREVAPRKHLLNDTDLRRFEQVLQSAAFQRAQGNLRDLLRRHLIRALGGDWEQIHNEYGMYTINCRAKSVPRILDKFRRLAALRGDVSLQNFYRLMPDLAAARLVVVDPGDMFRLAEKVRQGCLEPKFYKPDLPHVPARVRHGRLSMYEMNSFRETKAYEIQEESTGYCSVHFVFRTGEDFYQHLCLDEEIAPFRSLDTDGVIPMTAWHVEVQVRTIMDEAWCETDHFVRYEDDLVRDDPEIRDQFAALAAYLQAANHHVHVIRNAARRKKGSSR